MPSVADIFSKAEKARAANAKNALAVIQDKPAKLTKTQQERLELENRWANMKVDVPANCLLVDSKSKFYDMTDDLFRCQAIGLDSETTGLDWTRDKMAGASFYSPESDLAYYVPLLHPGVTNISLESFVNSLKNFLCKVGLVGHNIPFDYHFFAGIGIYLNKILYDTQTGSIILNENESHKLKDLVVAYGIDKSAKTYSALFGNALFINVPFHLAWPYAAKDPMLTWYLMEYQIENMERYQLDDLQRLIRDLEIPILPVAIEMECTGLHMDMAYVKEKEALVTEKVDTLREEIIPQLQAPYKKFLEDRVKWWWPKIVAPAAVKAGFTEFDETPNLTLQSIGELAYKHLNVASPQGWEKRGVKLSSLKAKMKAHLNEDHRNLIDTLLDYLEMQETLTNITADWIWEPNLGSPLQLQDVIFDVLALPEIDGRKTEDEVLAVLAAVVSKSVIDDMGAKHGVCPAEEPGKFYKFGEYGKIIASIRGWREWSKVNTSFLQKFPRVMGADGLMHTSLNTLGAKTGRTSSSGSGDLGTNLQQLPIKPVNVRAAFNAGPGRLLMSIDYSQIELRVLAHWTGCKALIEAYLRGDDIHKQTAAIVNKCSLDDVDDYMRKSAKAVNFGLIYGQTEYGLSAGLGITKKEAKGMIENYFSGLPEVKQAIQETIQHCERDGLVSTILGRRRRLPEIWEPDITDNWGRQRKSQGRGYAERQSFNHIIQGSAQDIIKTAMVKLWKYRLETKYDFRFVLQVHDELLFSIPESWAEQREVEVMDEQTKELQQVMKWVPIHTACCEIQEIMKNAIPLSVPVDCDLAIGKTWGELG